MIPLRMRFVNSFFQNFLIFFKLRAYCTFDKIFTAFLCSFTKHLYGKYCW